MTKPWTPGTYVNTITLADIPDGFPPILEGHWKFTFAADNSYVVYKDGRLVVRGEYIIEADQLVQTDKDGPMALPF